MRLKTMLVIGLCIAAGVPALSAHAQSDLPDNKKSVVMFDLQLDKLRSSKLYKEAGMGEMITDAMQNGPAGDLDPNSLSRIVGAVSAPESVAAFEEMGPESALPLEFFVQLRFVDEESANMAFTQIEENSVEVERGGNTYYKPDGGGEPANLVAFRPNPKTVEIGTEGYIYQQGRNFMTERLLTTWRSMPNVAIRLAIDMESAEDLVAEGTAMAQENAPPQAEMFIKLIDKVSTLQLAIDLDTQNLVELHAEGKSEEDAASLAGGLEALLGMAKLFGKQGLAMAAEESPETAKMATEMLDALAAKQDGTKVSIVVSKPDGFDQAMIAAITEAKAAAGKAAEMNNFRQHALAVHNFHDTFRGFPWTAPKGSGQSEDISWRVRILAFSDQFELYDQLDLEQAHDGDTNKMFAEQMPASYGADGKNANVCWIKSDVKTFADITDGSSNTIMFIENPAGVPWMQPKDLTIDEAVELVTGLMEGQSLNVAYYDGSVDKISSDVPEETLRLLFDPADGKPIENFDR